MVAIARALVRSYERRRFAWPSALVVPLCLCALWSDEGRYVLAMPVIINAVRFGTFFGSQFRRKPLVERFARMQVSDLSATEIMYRRSVTKVWSAFFVLNGATAAGLALWGQLKLWILYTGGWSRIY